MSPRYADSVARQLPFYVQKRSTTAEESLYTDWIDEPVFCFVFDSFETRIEHHTERMNNIMEDQVSTTHSHSKEAGLEMQPAEEASVIGSARKGENVDNHSENNGQYLTGIELVLIVSSVALACFLMLLDTMVVSTVRCTADCEG